MGRFRDCGEGFQNTLSAGEVEGHVNRGKVEVKNRKSDLPKGAAELSRDQG